VLVLACAELGFLDIGRVRNLSCGALSHERTHPEKQGAIRDSEGSAHVLLYERAKSS
jgi:hypothetical protein